MVSESMVHSVERKMCDMVGLMEELGEVRFRYSSSGNTCTAIWLDDVDKSLGGIMKKHSPYSWNRVDGMKAQCRAVCGLYGLE